MFCPFLPIRGDLHMEIAESLMWRMAAELKRAFNNLSYVEFLETRKTTQKAKDFSYS